jgi:hypothetical protein
MCMYNCTVRRTLHINLFKVNFKIITLLIHYKFPGQFSSLTDFQKRNYG